MARKQKKATPTKRLFHDPTGQEHMFEKSLEEELEAKKNAPVECLGMTNPSKPPGIPVDSQSLTFPG
jgi:hypothetical protein